MRSRAVLLILMVVLVRVCAAAPAPVDVEHSKLTIRVFKSGLFSGFAHDHEIAAPVVSGRIDAAARAVEVRFDARKLRVLDPELSPADRAKVQETMLSDKVLDADRFPDIVFVARRVAPAADTKYVVEGELTLHGVTRPITVPVSLANQRYVGGVKLKQTDFGIKPVKVMGGTVKVKDVIEISFEIAPSASAPQAAF